MRFFAVGQHAEGVIAIGQEATGFFALGQFATGVIAIGQVARGFIAIGQLALGFFAVGQLALGVSFCAAMLGAGGRSLGIVLPLVPVPPRKKKVPTLGDPGALPPGGSTWVRGKVVHAGGARFAVEHDGRQLPVSVPYDLALAAYGVAKKGTDLFLEVSRDAHGAGGSYRLRTMKNYAESEHRRPWLRGLSVVQLALLLVAAWAYWQFFVVDLVDFVMRLAEDAAQTGISIT